MQPFIASGSPGCVLTRRRPGCPLKFASRHTCPAYAAVRLPAVSHPAVAGRRRGIGSYRSHPWRVFVRGKSRLNIEHRTDDLSIFDLTYPIVNIEGNVSFRRSRVAATRNLNTDISSGAEYYVPIVRPVKRFLVVLPC